MCIAILGVGTMARGIALTGVVASHDGTVSDVDEDILVSACEEVASTIHGGICDDSLTSQSAAVTRARSTPTDLDGLPGEYIGVEAVSDAFAHEQQVLATIDAFVECCTSLATETSSLSVTAVGNCHVTPERADGLHVGTIVHGIVFAKMIIADHTTDGICERPTVLVEGIDKTHIHVSGGPVSAPSRMGIGLGTEAMEIIQVRIASPRKVDSAMQLGYNHTRGTLELTDLAGLDVKHDELEYIREELRERFLPPLLLKRKVAGGNPSRKTEKGFYSRGSGRSHRDERALGGVER